MPDNDELLDTAQQSSDAILFNLALRAGAMPDEWLCGVEELYIESIAEDGTYAFETWCQFELEQPEGQHYYAHLPGPLDQLIVRTVRDHSVLLGGE